MSGVHVSDFCLVSRRPVVVAVLLWSFVFMLQLFMSRMFPLVHFFCHSSGTSGSILYASSIPLD